MTVPSTTNAFPFQTPSTLPLQASFDGGPITSDGGALLLAEVERHTGILAQLAACFTDYRDPDLLEHSVPQLLAQRVYGIALATRISTITTASAPTPCWPPWSARTIRSANAA